VFKPGGEGHTSVKGLGGFESPDINARASELRGKGCLPKSPFLGEILLIKIAFQKKTSPREKFKRNHEGLELH